MWERKLQMWPGLREIAHRERLKERIFFLCTGTFPPSKLQALQHSNDQPSALEREGERQREREREGESGTPLRFCTLITKISVE